MLRFENLYWKRKKIWNFVLSTKNSHLVLIAWASFGEKESEEKKRLKYKTLKNTWTTFCLFSLDIFFTKLRFVTNYFLRYLLKIGFLERIKKVSFIFEARRRDCAQGSCQLYQSSLSLRFFTWIACYEWEIKGKVRASARVCVRVWEWEREGWSFAEEANAPTSFKTSPLSAPAAFSLSHSLTLMHMYTRALSLSFSKVLWKSSPWGQGQKWSERKGEKSVQYVAHSPPVLAIR